MVLTTFVNFKRKRRLKKVKKAQTYLFVFDRSYTKGRPKVRKLNALPNLFKVNLTQRFI